MLKQLLSKIQEEKIISEKIFENLDADSFLELRDEEEFDKEWMRVYNFILGKKIEHEAKMEIDIIREEIYMKAYKFSNSSDIAACISDDFEMICNAYILDVNDDWLNAMIDSYANNTLPCGRLDLKKGDINILLKNLLS